jgi:Spy/CpxP family protein refolding chaperone
LEKEVSKLRRILLILAAAALMAMLVATSAAPAFADPPEKWGHQCGGEQHSGPGPEKNGIKGDNNCGFHYSPENR